MNKIDKFLTRNRRRNAHLYQDGLVCGEDYVVCPVSNARLSMIKRSYIERILGMTVDEYDNKYPNVKKICNGRIDKIKQGLKEIDPETGLTKYELSQVKAKEVLSQVGEDGMTGYARKGQKTKNTHMNNIDEFGRNGYAQLAADAIIKGNTTKAQNGIIANPEERGEYHRYRAIVSCLTNSYRKSLTQGYKMGLAGIEGAHHIDHVYSMINGFHNKVSPLVIGHVENLRVIPWEENITKNAKSGIELNDLLQKVGYTIERSEKEYEMIMSFIAEDIKNCVPVRGAKLIEKLYESDIIIEYGI